MTVVFSFLDYKSMHAFGQDFRDVARRIEEKIRGRRFYLIMDCSDKDSVFEQNSKRHREDKSNYFMFVLLMCIHPTLIDQLEDFVCTNVPASGGWTPVHSKRNDSVSVFVYMDDVAFTGSQARHNTFIEDASEFELIYGSVYASNEAIRMVEYSGEEYGSHAIITSGFRPRLMSKHVVTEKYLSTTTTPMDDELRDEALRSLGMLTGEEKYLFYTDLKIPDQLSTFINIIPQTRLIDVDGKFEGEYEPSNRRYSHGAGYNFVEGGYYNFDSEFGRWYAVIDHPLDTEGNAVREPPVYKTKPWEAFVRDLRGDIYSRKRSRSGNLLDPS
ncbi:unnamed protein product [Ectocarpus sp. 6 AP-2014]